MSNIIESVLAIESKFILYMEKVLRWGQGILFIV